MGLFKKKNKKVDPKKGYDKDTLQGISSKKIHIKVFRDFGNNARFLMGQYFATEKRDAYNTLVSINEAAGHNEDVDFGMDDVYREMQIVLEFKNLSKVEKLDLLDRKIARQEKIILYLNRHIELNALFNYADESVKLRDYRILKNYVNLHEEQGSYFTIENGMRVYSFVSVDSVLVPIWHNVDSYTQIPDHTRKKKINLQEEKTFLNEMKAFSRDKVIALSLTVALALVVLLFMTTVFAGYKVWNKNNDIEEKMHASAFSCAQYTAGIHTQYGSMVTDWLNEKKADRAEIEAEEVKKKPDVMADAVKSLNPIGE